MAGSILSIVCNPEIECSNTGTISNFENVYPGFQTIRKITVTNNRDSQCDLKLQTQVNNSDSPIFKFTKISFSGKDINLFSNQESLIDVLNSNQKKDISLRFYVSTKADNTFTNQSEKINFNFKINCVPVLTSSGSIAGISTLNKPFCPFFFVVDLCFFRHSNFTFYFKIGKKSGIIYTEYSEKLFLSSICSKRKKQPSSFAS